MNENTLKIKQVEEDLDRVRECIKFIYQDVEQLETFAEHLRSVEAFRLGTLQKALHESLAEIDSKLDDVWITLYEIKKETNGQIPLGNQPAE
jgi:hypothetical protein